MANFKVNGLDGLTLSLQQIAEIPEDVQYSILEAGADIVKSTQTAKVRAAGLVKSGRLARSIEAQRKALSIGSSNPAPGIVVYPTGTYPREARRKKGKGKPKPVRVAEVGFILNFGAPYRHIRARSWVDNANTQCAAAVEKAEFDVYDKWLKSKNL